LSAARVAAHDTPGYQAVGIGVERAACGDVFELPSGRVATESLRIGVDLGDLRSGRLGVRAEVGQAARPTWLTVPTAWVAADIAARGKPPNELEECRANRHILEHPGSLRIIEACGVGHDLGQLASGHVVIGSECAVSIPVDDAQAGETMDIGVESRARGHVGEGKRARRWSRRG